MGTNPKSVANLKKGNPATQFKAGREQVEKARKAGIASGQARKTRKKLSAIAATIAANPLPKDAKKGRAALERMGVADEDMTCDALVVAGIYGKACQGDTKAVDKWESWQQEEDQTGINAIEKALSTMRSNFASNVNSNFGNFVLSALHHRYVHYDLAGGRGSTKSSVVSLTVVRLMMETGNEEVNALVLRKVGNTIKDSVFAQYQWAISTLGVSDYWETKNNPPELIYKPTGQRIVFRGADKPLKLKSIKMAYGYIGITHFEEKDQFSGRKEIRTILQSTMRGGEVFWNFESYNPPISRDNWANKDSAEERGDRLCHRSNYLELDYPEWLGEQFVAEAEHLRETNFRAYQHEYLGIPVGNGGNVFDNLDLREITDEELSHFDRIYQGVDWGWFPDPYAFIRVHYDSAREVIYILDELYVNKTSNEDTAKWILDKGYNDAYTTCDSAEPKSVADYRSLGVNAKEAIKGQGSVDYGMKWLQKRSSVIDKKRTPHAYEEFVNYEYEKNKDDEWLSNYPDANNHLIDALRYALERVFKRYGSNA